MSQRPGPLSRGLAAAFLDGPWTLSELVARGTDALGRRTRGLSRLVRRVLLEFPEPPYGRCDGLAAFIHNSEDLGYGHIRHWHTPEPRMAVPLPALALLVLPRLSCRGDVAEWLGIAASQLEWLADEHRHLRSAVGSRLRHYRYKWIVKRSGAYRLLEAPKPTLKAIQRRILHEILDRVPLHDAAHGFRRGRSILSNAASHVDQDVVLRLDLAEFFATITEARVRAIFASLGYPDSVARTLAALCCTPTPFAMWHSAPPPADPTSLIRERYFQRQLLSASHLPQGAPTSPALANLAAYRLDCRLAGLAAKWQAHYSRYADDLAFSGDKRLGSRATTLIATVAAIAGEEGFAVLPRKTRLMRRAVRQQLAGIVVNVRPGLARNELKRLEAILYNCVRHGPQTQNRAAHADFHAHLAGHVAWAEYAGPASRARRLRALFEQIEW